VPRGADVRGQAFQRGHAGVELAQQVGAAPQGRGGLLALACHRHRVGNALQHHVDPELRTPLRRLHQPAIAALVGQTQQAVTVRQHRIGQGQQQAGTVALALALGEQQAGPTLAQDGHLARHEFGTRIDLGRVEEEDPHTHAEHIGLVMPGQRFSGGRVGHQRDAVSRGRPPDAAGAGVAGRSGAVAGGRGRACAGGADPAGAPWLSWWAGRACGVAGAGAAGATGAVGGASGGPTCTWAVHNAAPRPRPTAASFNAPSCKAPAAGLPVCGAGLAAAAGGAVGSAGAPGSAPSGASTGSTSTQRTPLTPWAVNWLAI